MGIKGLSTFIEKRCLSCYKDSDLCDTFLVVDAYNLLNYLYDRLPDRHILYGGDYDIFAQLVREFLDELLLCNIEPLFIFDGGVEGKKLDLILKRTDEKMQRIPVFQNGKKSTYKPFAPFSANVFRGILKEKGIKYVRASLEADDSIASVARLLNCPLLTYDSDFYLYDVTYIPTKYLEEGFFVRRDGKLAKRCKVYRVAEFCKLYPGLKTTLMPLVAVLLGNDYLTGNEAFEDFYPTLKLPSKVQRVPKEFHKFEAVFYFLQHNSLPGAITKILNRIKTGYRDSILRIIEIIVNDYFQCSPQLLSALGFSEKEITQFVKNVQLEPFANEQFKFPVIDLDAIDLAEEPLKSNEFYLEFFPGTGKSVFTTEKNEYNILETLPNWFIKEYNKGDLPNYFMDLLTRKLYICSPRVEDYSQPTCVKMSENILKTIFQLLRNENSFKYYARKAGNKVGCMYEIKTETNKEFPSLSNLRQTPIEDRKTIFHNAVGVEEGHFSNIPNEWKLYVISIFHWIENTHKSKLMSRFHIYSVIVSMLFNIVDRQIGFYRTKKKFQEAEEKIPNSSKFANLEQTLLRVSYEECTKVVNYFQERFQKPEKVEKNLMPLLHPFMQFQICLEHIDDLNTLLGYVYQRPKLFELYNGTLMFNVLQDLSSNKKECETFLEQNFEMAPNLYRVFLCIEACLQPALNRFRDNMELSKEKIFGETPPIDPLLDRCRDFSVLDYKQKKKVLGV